MLLILWHTTWWPQAAFKLIILRQNVLYRKWHGYCRQVLQGIRSAHEMHDTKFHKCMQINQNIYFIIFKRSTKK